MICPVCKGSGQEGLFDRLNKLDVIGCRRCQSTGKIDHYTSFDFEKGTRVSYLPYKNCDPSKYEYGTVNSINATSVFVKFDTQISRLGWDGTTSQSCMPSSLKIL